MKLTIVLIIAAVLAWSAADRRQETLVDLDKYCLTCVVPWTAMQSRKR